MENQDIPKKKRRKNKTEKVEIATQDAKRKNDGFPFFIFLSFSEQLDSRLEKKFCVYKNWLNWCCIVDTNLFFTIVPIPLLILMPFEEKVQL